ncbi:hypothetical protein pb186bvf_019167 [Paramecium bursaria]
MLQSIHNIYYNHLKYKNLNCFSYIPQCYILIYKLQEYYYIIDIKNNRNQINHQNIQN